MYLTTLYQTNTVRAGFRIIFVKEYQVNFMEASSYVSNFYRVILIKFQIFNGKNMLKKICENTCPAYSLITRSGLDGVL